MVWLALAHHEVVIKSNPQWWEVFGASTEEMENIGACLLAIYDRPLRPDLPLTAEELKQRL
jgi:hypothetical protein